MHSLFRKLLGRKPQTQPVRKHAEAPADSPVTIQDGSDNAMRRQLIMVLLRDVLRRHGLPQQWIELQMLVVSSASRGSGLYVRLVVKHWDARLLNYAQAFQNELLADIGRFEPKASEWLHGISWQLEMGESCPYTALPDKAFWQEPAAAQLPVAPPVRPKQPASTAAPFTSTPENDAIEDLHQLFFIRDREINGAAETDGPLEYEATRPLPL